ncbi:hypothetical protein WJX84_002061 [Apatococcus fuscideae]|uniref:peptidylprolyl isomerase n=1 Tax=Apatococcus fuscideae TaxID=2026836 RepID=A0AAW1TEH3_9CHLO
MNFLLQQHSTQSCQICQRLPCTLRMRLQGRQASVLPVRAACQGSEAPSNGTAHLTRRQLGLAQTVLLATAALTVRPQIAQAAGLPVEERKMICDADCQAKLESLQMVTTSSGLKYKDIVTGKGPEPPVGYQVVANYVAMTPQGKIFDSSLDRGSPYDFRVGSGQVIPGLDEGIRGMQPGGVRRLYIPGNLAFPKGVASAAGRPRVPPSSAVVFDVQLVYVPGLEADE